MGHSILIEDPIGGILNSQTQLCSPEISHGELRLPYLKLDAGEIALVSLKGRQYDAASSAKQDKTMALHELWSNVFADPQWWDTRFNKRRAGPPYFLHPITKDASWIDGWWDTPWAREQLANIKEDETQFGVIAKDLSRMLFGRLRNLCKEGQLYSALCAMDLLDQRGIYVSSSILLCLIQSCISKADLEAGRKVYCFIIRIGDNLDADLGSHLIRMFALCGSLLEANQVFRKLAKPNVFTWSAIISVNAKLGEDEHAIRLYHQMQQSGVEPDGHVFVAVLKACSNLAALDEGKSIHACICHRGLDFDVFVVNSLIDMYSKCGSIGDARKVFDNSPKRNVVTWNAVIVGYVQNGQGLEALRLFHQMQRQCIKPDRITFVTILKVCSSVVTLGQGKLIHHQVIERGLESDTLVISTLIDMYGNYGNLNEAHRVFSEGPKHDVVTWNAMIAGYAQHGHIQEALRLFQEMQQDGVESNTSTFVSMLKGVSHVAALDQGKLIHKHIIKRGFATDVLVMNTLINMYAKCGSLQHAQRVFDHLSKHDLVTWNAMISAFAQHGHCQESLQIFHQLQINGLEPNQATFVGILKACSNVADLDKGYLIHHLIVERGLELEVVLVNNLIDLYMKCGSLNDACRVFDDSPKQDVVTWTSTIAGHVQHGYGQKALRLFQQMQQEGMEPNQATFVSILKACSSSSDAALDQGKLIHELIIERGLESDVSVMNTLLDMYTKCGSLEDGCRVFDESLKRDVVTWTTMIAGYVHHEHGQNALQLYQRMQQEGVQPDRVTFVSLLKACSSVAALSQGKLIHDYSIERDIESDGSILNTLIDMYVKCGSLGHARRLFEKSSTRDVVTWTAMIAGCAQYRDYHLALQYFHDMEQDGVEPNAVTFLSLLSACSHLGLVDEGFLHLKSMMDFGIAPSFEHFTCMAEVLGHAGHLSAAEDLFETIPFQPDIVGWISLLLYCRRQSEADLGRRCFDHVVKMDCRNAAAYVLMSNIYAVAGMREDAVNIEKLRICANAWKKPGKAFIEVDNTVHEFTGGDNSHPKSDDIVAKMKRLNVQMKKKGYLPCFDLLLQSISDEEKEDVLCGHCEKQAIVFGLLTMPQGTTIRVTKNLRMCADCHNATGVISQIEMREIIVVDEHCVHLFKDGACSCKDYY